MKNYSTVSIHHKGITMPKLMPKKSEHYLEPGYFDKHLDEFYSPDKLSRLISEAKKSRAFFNRIGAKVVTKQMKILFSETAWDSFNSEKLQKKNKGKLLKFIKEIERQGVLSGTGHPETLSGNLQDFYSRRINKKDRMVYQVLEMQAFGDILFILDIDGHYGDRQESLKR